MKSKRKLESGQGKGVEKKATRSQSAKSASASNERKLLKELSLAKQGIHTMETDLAQTMEFETEQIGRLRMFRQAELEAKMNKRSKRVARLEHVIKNLKKNVGIKTQPQLASPAIDTTERAREASILDTSTPEGRH